MNVYGTGNVVADAELKEIGEKKTKLAQFTVAVNRRREGREPEVSFFDVKAWSYAAENARGFKKGDFVYVEGELKQERWEKDGKKNSKVIINSFKCFKASFPGKSTTESNAVDNGEGVDVDSKDNVPF
jgi:single stranded DNA-binding protein